LYEYDIILLNVFLFLASSNHSFLPESCKVVLQQKYIDGIVNIVFCFPFSRSSVPPPYAQTCNPLCRGIQEQQKHVWKTLKGSSLFLE
jgi:hypothetical protein